MLPFLVARPETYSIFKKVMNTVEIVEAKESDLVSVLDIVSQAFGEEDVASLVRDLVNDETAEPVVSLLARKEDLDVGHILFTRARLEPENHFNVSILAPLAVVPDFQKQGIGGQLIEAGLEILRVNDVSLVFVLGYPGYYNRHGFISAGRLGLDAPYPIPQKNSDAWMVRELFSGKLGNYRGTVRCAASMDRAEYWRE